MNNKIGLKFLQKRFTIGWCYKTFRLYNASLGTKTLAYLS
jgi:hypothetical protein